MKINESFTPKEVSWLSFNERVLQEAERSDNLLGDRFTFLGIYSNNLDEFFRVRVANLLRFTARNEGTDIYEKLNPEQIIERIEEIIGGHRIRFEEIYNQLLSELEKKNIRLLRHTDVSGDQEKFVKDYFDITVRPKIFPMMIEKHYRVPELNDNSLYLAVELHLQNKKKKYCVIEIPTQILPRFVEIPGDDKTKDIMLIDEVVRFGLPYIYKMFKIQKYHSYNIKITRDSALKLRDDIRSSYLTQISESLRRRKQGAVVRFVYDKAMPTEMFNYLLKKFHLGQVRFFYGGGRYHYFKDLIGFAKIAGLKKRSLPHPVKHIHLKGKPRLIEAIREQDVLLNFPYQSFNYMIDLLREASMDPKVTSIKITLYRVAQYSSIVNALMNAIRNHKRVTVVLELQARFDENMNVYWAQKLKDEGAHVIFGLKGLKTHAKLCLITRRHGKSTQSYISCVGTGNFNEETAKLYTDTFYLTGKKSIGREISQIFTFLERTYNIGHFEHLMVSPLYLRSGLNELIKREISNAREQKPAYIYIKINNLSDPEFTQQLYDASQAGVKIKLIVRSMFSVKPGMKGFSENIEAISIVGKYLEHSRFYIFANDGDPKVYISSADLLPRNLDRRVEVACPIYDKTLKNRIIQIFNTHWKDNTNARVLDEKLSNVRKTPESNEKKWCSQDKVYDYILTNHEGLED